MGRFGRPAEIARLRLESSRRNPYRCYLYWLPRLIDPVMVVPPLYIVLGLVGLDLLWLNECLYRRRFIAWRFLATTFGAWWRVSAQPVTLEQQRIHRY